MGLPQPVPSRLNGPSATEHDRVEKDRHLALDLFAFRIDGVALVGNAAFQKTVPIGPMVD